MPAARLGIGAAALAAALSLLPGRADAACVRDRHDGIGYTVCTARAGVDDLRIWFTDSTGAAFGSFRRIDNALEGEGARLGFAMNAGMYHRDLRAVGLLIVDGEERAPIVLRAGPGNFGLLPNGVFCITPDRFVLRESRAFDADRPDCRFATQSGPMLVIDGALHPRFLPQSNSRFVRNGVGISPDGSTAWFVISDDPVTFHEFARIFRDRFAAPQALYLDGNVSRLHAPGLSRSDWGLPMGPVIGTASSFDSNG